MRKVWKKFVTVCGCLAAASVGIVPVPAAEVGVNERQGVMAVEDTYTPRTRGRVFYQGYIQLTDHDGVAGIHGETLAEVEADEVGLNLYLEKYNGSNFDSYKYWKTVEYNVSKNIKSYQISVPQGYYYRLRGFHYVDADGIYESGGTITEGLKIPQ